MILHTVTRRPLHRVLLSALFIGLPILILVFSFSSQSHAKTVKIKVATLAPEGSTWWKIFQEADQRVRELSAGSLRIKLYAGGVAGDEQDVLRKMRSGQLHGAAITSVGLGTIVPDMLVLQAPGLIQTWDELDFIRGKLKDKFAKLMADKGYNIMMWGDVGFNRLFSKQKITTPQALAQNKPWCWTLDPVLHQFYKTVAAKPVLLGVPEVLPGLQTGLIDTFVTAPLAAVALQWSTRAKYMLDFPLSPNIGMVVLSKKKYDKLSKEHQKILAQVGHEIGPKLAKTVRADNISSIEAMRDQGVTIQSPTAAQKTAWQTASSESAHTAANTEHIFPVALLQEVQALLSTYRTSHGK